MGNRVPIREEFMDKQFRHACRFGAFASLLAGMFYVCIVTCAFILPSSIATYVASPEYFQDFIQHKNLFIALKYLMMGANLAMIGVVTSFYFLCRDEKRPIMAWVSTTALIGYGVGMYQSVQDLSMIPLLAEKYMSGDILVKDMIITMGVSNPALFIVTLGLPGIWFIVISLEALSNKYIPKALVFLGLMWGVGNIMTAIAHALVILPLIYLVALGALIFAPLWSIFEGLFLLRISKEGLDYLDKK